MFGRLDDERGWKPWLRKSLLKDPRPSYSGGRKVDRGPRRGPHALVLFVRIQHGEKSEMCTLRDLHDGMKVYQIKAQLELLSGIPTSMMDLHLIKDKSFNDDDVLILGRNISFGGTIRVSMNSSWNELLQSAWKGSLTDVRRYLTLLEKRTQSPIAFPNSDVHATREMEREDLLSKALFVVSHRGNEKICKLLLKKGANTTYTTSFGNSSLHTAASAGHLIIIQLLVSHGANVQCRNIHGKSPLEVAVNKGYFDCARWLWLNQWSLAITKDIVAQPKNNAFLKPNMSSKSFLTSAYPNDARPSSTEFRCNARTLSSVPFRQSDRPKRFSSRPHTAYALSQTLHPNTAEAHNSRRPNSARLSVLPHSHNEQSNKRGNVNSLQYDKTAQIVNFFTSRKDRQRSIPSKNATFSAEISNNEVIVTKLELRSQKEFREVIRGCETRSSTTLTSLRPSSTNVGSGNGKWNNVLPSRDRCDEAETVLEGESDSSVEENDDFLFEMAMIYQSQKPEESSIVDTSAPLPSPTFLLSKFAPIETSWKHESPDIVQDEFKSEKVLTIPTTTMNYMDIHSDRSSDDGSRAQQHRVLNVKENIPNTPESLEKADENYSAKSPHQSDLPSLTEYSSFSDSKQNAVKSESAELEKIHNRQTRNSKSVHFQIEISAEINDPIATSNAEDANSRDRRAMSSVQIVEKPSAEIYQSAVSVNKKITSTEKHSVPFEGNSEDHVAYICRKRVPEMKKKPSRTSFSSESSRNSRRTSHGWSRKGDDHEKGEQNRKAFEIWLVKKRISQTRRKEAEAEKLEKLERKQSRSHRTSTSMTFDEWLRTKDEEDEISPHEEPKTTYTTKKRENKYQKTFDDWVTEKEEEKWNEFERRKSVEAERKLKEEQEGEKRKKEYEQKLQAWKRKKEDSKRNEFERKKRMDQMAMEYGYLMYEEWLSKPRVKSFDEWKKNKAQESRLNEVSKAQSEMIEKQEKEMEEIRHQIAKEKFQQWVMKKELSKQKTSEVELEKTKKRRKNRRRLRNLMLNEEGEE